MNRITRAAIKLTFILLLVGCTKQNGLVITDAWARPANAGDISAVYLIIDNPTGDNEKLLKVISGIAEAVEIHNSSMDENGTMSMAPQDEVAIPAREIIKFEPGGLHLMLVGLTNRLSAGDVFEITLAFEKAGEEVIEVEVREP